MPSKSKAQHNLMAAVANNPAFAKKAGIPQSVGKDYMKADKRKGKKFALGGPTSYSGEDSGEGMKMSTRRSGSSGEGSFKDAFRAAKDGSVFEWKGKKYKKEYADKKKSEAPKVEAPKVEVEKKTETKVEVPAGPRRTAGGRGAKLPEGYKPKVGSGRFDDPTSSYGERVLSPLKKLTDIFGRREEERVMRNMGVSREEARKRIDAKEDAEEGMRHGGKVKKMRGGGMPDLTGDGKITRADVLKGRGVFKHGGGVKRYASGGSVSSASKRADGIAKKGKTRGKIC